MLTKEEIMRCSCNGEAHDECHRCADCDEQPALNDVVDDPDGGVMYLCDECYEERVEADERRVKQQYADERPLTKQQQAWFDAYTGELR
jgi:hypothetical protein